MSAAPYLVSIAMLFACFFATHSERRKAERTLANLRAKCWLTNEKGHRVPYAKASDAVRARAEG